MDDLTFRDKGSDNQRRVIAKLCGCRLVTANEGNARVRLDMALLKTLASSDLLSGAHLYENEFTFTPTHKLVLATNNKPDLEIDDAARRRVHLVPFNVSFRGREDRNISEKLKAEAPGILHLMIQACLDWQRVGLNPPQSVTDATTGLFRDLDPLGRFMDECLEKDANGFEFSTDLITAYTRFLQDNGEELYIESKQFVQSLKERGGFVSTKRLDPHGKQARGLRGVKIKKDPIT